MASTKITQFIGGHEGKVLTWYLDPVHVPTIGYGFTWSSSIFRAWWMSHRGRKMQRGDTMTAAEALEVLGLVIAEEVAPKVDSKLTSVPLQVREPAYSLVFNCGPGALGWKWAGSVLRGDIKTAAAQWRASGTTAKGKTLPGLVRRRNAEADIAQFNRWPAWMDGLPAGPAVPPETHTVADDVKQAQLWLETLGYSPGPADGVPGKRTQLAVERFQRDHGTLAVDGRIGPATLSALQRTVDLRKKGGAVAGGGVVATGAGTADNATGAADGLAPWLGDAVLWGGIAIAVVALVYLAWRYRDEINALVRRL